MLGWRGIAWFSRSWNERGGRPGASQQRRRQRVRSGVGVGVGGDDVGGGGGGGGGGGVGRAQRRGRESGARSTDALGGEGARGEGTLSAAIAAARLFHFVGRCAKPYAHTCGWRNIRAGKCAAGLAGAHYEAWPTPNPLTLIHPHPNSNPNPNPIK